MTPSSPQPNRRLKAYIVGFSSSVVLTLAAYLLVTSHQLSSRALWISIATLALIQFVVQLVFFLHLGQESAPRWRRLTLYFMIGVVVILVAGSLWIMHNLNYHMLTPEQMNHYINSQNGF